MINLSELLRVIELYNTRFGTTRTGAYLMEEGTEDGFNPDSALENGMATSLTEFHSADSDNDGRVNLSELLRVIELYNFRDGTVRTGFYHRSLTSDDGFDPGGGG